MTNFHKIHYNFYISWSGSQYISYQKLHMMEALFQKPKHRFEYR